MAYGLQSFNSAGILVFDSSRLSRFVSSHYRGVSTTTSFNVTVPGMSNDGTWAVTVPIGVPVTINSGYFNVGNQYSFPAQNVNYVTFVVWRY